MKKNNYLDKIFIIILFGAAVTGLVRHFHIMDFTVIQPSVLYTSGQPKGMDYTRLLYKYHIATIINIRPVSEHQERNWRNEEINWTRSNGVNYIEIPIERQNYFPDSQMQEQFLNIMSKKENLPVLLHGSGDDKRVAMLAAVWLEKSENYSPEDTIATLQNIIDDRKLNAQELEFIRLLQK